MCIRDSLIFEFFGLLSAVLVLCTCIKTHSCCGLSAKCVVGEHTLNCELHSLFGLLAHELAVLYFLKTADVAGVPSVVLVLKLVAC